MVTAQNSEPSAILVADMVRSSERLAFDPIGTLRRFGKDLEELFRPTIQVHTGTIITKTGDGFIAVFADVIKSEECVQSLRSLVSRSDSPSSRDAPLIYRFSLHWGKIWRERDEVYGLDVNIACHMQDLAEPGGICISKTVYSLVPAARKKSYKFIGAKYLKNIPESIEIYHDIDSFDRSVMKDIFNEIPTIRRSFISPPPKLGVSQTVTLSQEVSNKGIERIIIDDLLNCLIQYRDLIDVSPLDFRNNVNYALDSRSRSVLSGENNLNYLVHSSIISQSSGVSCTFYLLHLLTDRCVWSSRIHFGVTGPDALMQEIADNVVAPIIYYIRRNETDSSILGFNNKTQSERDFRRANILAAKHDTKSIEEARSLLRAMISKIGDVADVHLALARAEHLYGRLFAGGRFAEALERASDHATKAIEIDESNPRAHAEFAMQEMFQRRYDRALKSYERALALNPYDQMLQADWADCLVFMGRTAEALPVLERVASGWPMDRSWVLWNLADARWTLNQPDKIIELLSGTPSRPHVHRLLAASYAKLDRIEEASFHADMIRFYQPDFSPRLWGELMPHSQSDISAEFADCLSRAGL